MLRSVAFCELQAGASNRLSAATDIYSLCSFSSSEGFSLVSVKGSDWPYVIC